MKKSSLLLVISAIIAGICANAAMSLEIVDGSIATLNNSVVLAATANTQSSTHQVNLSSNHPSNSSNALGISDPGEPGSGLETTNNPIPRTVTLPDLPLAATDDPFLETHPSQNELSRDSDIFFTIQEVLLTANNPIIWSLDEIKAAAAVEKESEAVAAEAEVAMTKPTQRLV